MHVGYVDQRDSSGSVIATRRTRTAGGNERFLIDFAIDNRAYDLPSVKVVATATGGTVSAQRIEAVPGQNVVRASFEVTAERQARDIELRAFLQDGEDVMTETWSYLFQPAPAAVMGARNH
jgi:glucans biosynthesis protein